MTGRPADRLTTFLYVLLRDHLPAGVVEAIMADHVEAAAGKEIVYSNQHLAAYADELASRIGGRVEAEIARLTAAEAENERLRDGLRRIAGRYCLHTEGDVRQESACLDKPSDQWCSICIARALLAEDEGPSSES